jgi:hypothetical protein
MIHIKPTNALVIDSLTGSYMPLVGVDREILLPADHKQLGRGEIVIITDEKPTEQPKKGGK